MILINPVTIAAPVSTQSPKASAKLSRNPPLVVAIMGAGGAGV
jgi:hypothetical protein